MPPLTALTARSLGTQQVPSGARRAQLHRPPAARSRAGPPRALGPQALAGLGLSNLVSGQIPWLLPLKKKKSPFENKQKSQN